MRIGVVAQLINHMEASGTAGLATYFENILKHLGDYDHEFILYTPSVPKDMRLENNVKIKKISLPFDRWPYYFWMNLRLPIELYKDKPDVLFSPWPRLPIICPCNSVITVHDIRPIYYADSLWEKATIFLAKNAIRQAKHIIAISEFTKKELIEKLGVNSKKISVVYNGYDKETFKPLNSDPVEKVKQKYDINNKYLLYVGSIMEHKNIETLIKAYSILKKDNKFNYKLVLAGKFGWGSENIVPLVKRHNLEADVIFTGYVPEEDIPCLMRGAEVFVFPSKYEGFGLPSLEAMACGTPVIVSNAASLPEVVGDAGFCVSPHKSKDWSYVIKKIINNKDLKENMRLKGLQRAKNFSWATTVEQIIKVVRNI